MTDQPRDTAPPKGDEEYSQVDAWASIMRNTSNVEDEYVVLRLHLAVPEGGRTQVDVRFDLGAFAYLITGKSDVKGEATVRERPPRTSGGIRRG